MCLFFGKIICSIEHPFKHRFKTGLKVNVWCKLHLKLPNLMILWSALPDLNRSPVSDEAFVLLRELSQQCLEDIYKGITTTTKQLLTTDIE